MMPDTDTHTLHADLLETMRVYAETHGDENVKRLGKPLLEGGLDRIDVDRKDHPAVPHLPEMYDCLDPAAKPVFDALMAAAPTLAWQVSYSTIDGFSEDYIRRYAWCDIIGPQGIYLSDEFRIGFGYWRKGLFYPPHEHGPEEIYWVIGGTGVFTSGVAEPAAKGPGSIIHHGPWVRHSIDMSESSVLVFFLWQGQNLHKRSNF